MKIREKILHPVKRRIKRRISSGVSEVIEEYSTWINQKKFNLKKNAVMLKKKVKCEKEEIEPKGIRKNQVEIRTKDKLLNSNKKYHSDFAPDDLNDKS